MSGTPSTAAVSAPRAPELSQGNVTVVPGPTREECVVALIDYLARISAHR